MAKRPAPAPPSRPVPGRLTDDQLRARNMMPFLRPNHVQENEQLRLTGFNNAREDNQIVCEVENEAGQSFNLGVRRGSPDHRVMHKTLGADYNRWTGHVVVTISKARTSGHPGFVNIKDASRFPAAWDTMSGGDEPPPHSDEDQES